MNIICKICGKQIKTTPLEHYRIMHPDYQWPNDMAEVGDEDTN